MVVAIAYWEQLPKIGPRVEAAAQHTMHWGATIALMGFCAGVMSRLHGEGEAHYNQVVHYILLMSVTVATIYLVTWLLFAHLGRRSALALGMLTANRNVALSFVLISEILPKDVLVYVAVAQFPIFLSPFAVRLFQSSLVASCIAALFPKQPSVDG